MRNELSPNEFKILDFLKTQEGYVGPTKIGVEAGNRKYSWASAWCGKVLQRLVARGLVETDDKGHYRVVRPIGGEGMTKEGRETYRYKLIYEGRIILKNVTNDLNRRTIEHQVRYPGSTVKQVGKRVTRESALAWLKREVKHQNLV